MNGKPFEQSVTKLLASAHDDVSGIELDEIARPEILNSRDSPAPAEIPAAAKTTLPPWAGRFDVHD